MPTTWASATAGSLRRTATTVRTVFRCVASRNRVMLGTPTGPAGKKAGQPVWPPIPRRAQPSREESISFLSPAQAAGALTFCYAAESKQRSQPRGFPPPWLTPAGATELSQALLRADASGALRRKPQLSSAERHRLSARGGGGSRHPKGSQFSCLLTSCKPSAKKVRPRARPPAPAHAVAALRGRRCFAPRLDRQNCSAQNSAEISL